MIIYHTNNLNKRLYRNMIWNILYHLKAYPLDFLKQWDIHIWGLEDTKPEFFDHITTTSGQKINPNMPSGVTGKYRIDLWLHDSDNDFKARENGDRIQHELCHAVLFGKPQFVSGVHGKNDQGERFQISFWFWKKVFWSRFYMTIIDIREFI